jgi:hypothetical protein
MFSSYRVWSTALNMVSVGVTVSIVMREMLVSDACLVLYSRPIIQGDVNTDQPTSWELISWHYTRPNKNFKTFE